MASAARVHGFFASGLASVPSKSKTSATARPAARKGRSLAPVVCTLGPYHHPHHSKAKALAVDAAAVVAAAALVVCPVWAIGPETVPLEVTGYERTPCPEGSPKTSLCVEVSAKATYTNKKPTYNSEVFGRVRFQDGESALYGDFAEASDSGKMGDIPTELSKDKTDVKFSLRLVENGLEKGELVFVNLKARTYPGMRADFRTMQPVTATEGDYECEEASFGLECPEDLP